MAFIIKSLDVAEPVNVSNIEELMIALPSYAGLSIAVHCRSKHGLMKPHFLDIHADGSATQSYGDKKPVTADYFKEQMSHE